MAQAANHGRIDIDTLVTEITSRRHDALDYTTLRETIKVMESGDDILMKLVEDLKIQFDFDGSVLTPEQRWALTKECLARLDYNEFLITAVMDWRYDAGDDAALCEVIKGLEGDDTELVELAKDFDIPCDYDGSVLVPEQRRALTKKYLSDLGYFVFDTAFREEAKELSEGGMTKEEREALGEQFDYDGSRLTPEQRQALFKSYWAMHLKMIGLRSPQYYVQYYGTKSQCLSVSDTAWPGTVTYLEAEKLKRVFIDPEDLIERLGKLKPSDNFELRKFRHPRMEWKSPTLLQEEGFEISPPNPNWLIKHLYAVNDMERRMMQQCRAGKSTASYRQIKESAAQFCQDINDRWDAVESSAELAPSPDLHLLGDMGRSPGGTLFPWYLVKGLITLREHANEMGGKSYDEEYEIAIVKREEAINRWRERNPDSILADDAISIYRTWPADLMAELDEIDREAIRCGRRKYVALLKEAAEKMQVLVTFWRDCGLVTGQRTPPSCWWQDPKRKVKTLHFPMPQYLKEELDAINTKFGYHSNKAEVHRTMAISHWEQFPIPQYLKERLDAINIKFSYHSDMAEKLRIIEKLRWLESIINGDSELTPSDTPLPPSLLDELDIVWRDRDLLDYDDFEDEMIAIFRRWRKSKHQQRLNEGLRTSPLGLDIDLEESTQMASLIYSGQMNLLRDSASGSVMGLEEMLQLREKLSKRTRGRPRTKITVAEDRAIWQGRLRSQTNLTIVEGQTIWQDRLRPRRGAGGASYEKPRPALRKPRGVVKQYGRKALEKERQAAAKGRATTATTQKAGISHLSSPQSHFNERSPQAIPDSVPKARRTKNLRRQPLHQPQGVRKTRNGNRRQTNGVMGAVLTTNRKQGLLRLLTPPQSA